MNFGKTLALRAFALCGLSMIVACSQESSSPADDVSPAPAVEHETTGEHEASGDDSQPSSEVQPSAAVSYSNVDVAPQFDADGNLLQPEGFRQWIFIGTPLTPNALNNGAAGFPEYHNVYTQAGAFDHYRATGEWPEGTMMVKELQVVKKDDTSFEDGSKLEPSGRGYFPHAVNGMDVSVKDSSRYGDTDNWGYFNFGHHAPPYAASAPAAPKEACAACHIANADEDMVFVNFYKAILDPLPTE